MSYSLALQQWLGDLAAEEEAFRARQDDLFEPDFDDPLPF